MRITSVLAAAALLLGVAACTQPWKEYDYPAWGFAASFRQAPVVTDTPASAKDGTPHTFQVEAQQGDRDLVVKVTDATGSQVGPAQLLQEIPDRMVRESEGTVTGHNAVTTDGQTGTEVIIDRGADPTERVRVFVANNRIYQVIAQTSNGGQDPEIVQFLNSFKLIK